MLFSVNKLNVKPMERYFSSLAQFLCSIYLFAMLHLSIYLFFYCYQLSLTLNYNFIVVFYVHSFDSQ